MYDYLLQSENDQWHCDSPAFIINFLCVCVFVQYQQIVNVGNYPYKLEI